MDFALAPEIEDFRQRYRAFVAEHILPVERDRENYDEHENIALPVLEELRGKAKAAGLWAPQMPKGRGCPSPAWPPATRRWGARSSVPSSLTARHPTTATC